MRNARPQRGGSKRTTTPRPPRTERADSIELSGKIVEVLPNAFFRVRLDNNHLVLAHVAGKMRKFFIKIIQGDTNASRQTTTNEVGIYRFDAVDLGTYTVSVSAKANGTAVTANALQLGTVNSISKASDGSVEANVSGIGTVPVSDIKLIL